MARVESTTAAQVLASGDLTPRDYKAVGAILRAMGAEQFQPRVPVQLLEFVHRYSMSVLMDATDFAAHRAPEEESPDISIDDLRLAIRARLSYSFQYPTPRDLMLQHASATNSMPMPVPPMLPGLCLPPEDQQLTSPNWQLVPAVAPAQMSSSPKPPAQQ
eukprot:m51a1_g14218 putative tata binding protein associated factor subunit 21 (160) ;mRNA; f:184436-185081